MSIPGVSPRTVPARRDPDPHVYSPSEDWAEASLDGSLAPAEIADRDTPPVLSRTFGFVDLCGFTATAEKADPDQLIEMLWAFRKAVRRISAARGVRVAKWLGDGAMIIGLDAPATVAACVDICARTYPLRARAGVTFGTAILFDGDDYVGRSPNLAARLCDIAAPGTTLAVVDPAEIPDWVRVVETGMREIRSVPEPVMVSVLEIAPGVDVPPISSAGRV